MTNHDDSFHDLNPFSHHVLFNSHPSIPSILQALMEKMEGRKLTEAEVVQLLKTKHLMTAQKGQSPMDNSNYCEWNFTAAKTIFTKLHSDKYAAESIRMNNVLPGFIDSLPETEDRKARIPMGRYGFASAVSSLISWLASADGSYMTGQNLRIDGGLTSAV